MHLSKNLRNAVRKCHECVHFQHSFDVNTNTYMEYSYGKCNRVYTRNKIETHFTLPAAMARRQPDFCGVEGKYFINKMDYVTNDWSIFS